MLSVDVVYESEILPRLVLLKQHMLSLQIELVLHTQTPAFHSGRVVYAPRSTNSELRDAVDDGCESIGLYFFNPPANTPPLPTDLAVALPTWPARSSDKAVAEFARYLHRAMAAERNNVSPRGSPDRRGARDIDWTGVRNLAILVGMIVAATWMIGQIPAETQPPEAENTTLPEAIVALPTASQSAATAVTAPTDATMSSSDHPLTPAHLEPAPLVERPRANACHGSSKEVLRAVLRLQAPTDFASCPNQRTPLNKNLADTNEIQYPRGH